jgi:iron complex outermembrane receptor protein
MTRLVLMGVFLAQMTGSVVQAQVKPDTDAAKEDLLDGFDFLDEPETKEKTETGLESLLETVVVTATKQKQTVASAPAIISVITASQIRAMGYRTVAEALQSLPGFHAISDHVEWNIGVRGINGGQRAASRIIKVMIDGQPVSFRPSTGNWLGEELIPIAAVNRIEVIRGPNSALYGANAFLGVVNIITRSGSLVNGAIFEAHTSLLRNRLKGYGGSLVLAKKSGNAEVLASASGSFTDRSGLEVGGVPGTTPSGLTSSDDTSMPASVFGKLFFQTTLGQVSVDLSYQRLHAHGEFVDWGPLAQGSQAGLSEDQKNLISLQNLCVRSRLSKSFLDNFHLAVSGAFSTMGPTSSDRVTVTPKTSTDAGDYFARDFGTTSADVVGELTYTLANVNSLTFGTDFTYDRHNLLTYWARKTKELHPADGDSLRPTFGDLLDDKDFSNLGVYIQSMLYPFQLLRVSSLEELGLTAGFRYDYHNIYGSTFNYRVGGVLALGKLTVKALFGTSFKAPASVQLFTGRLQPGGFVGNANLKPENAKTVEIQVGGEPLEGLKTTLTWFYNMVSDKVEPVPDPRTSNVSPLNIASIDGTGVEAELSYVWRGLTSYANFSYQKSLLKRPDPAAGVMAEDETGLYPPMMAKFGLNYSYPRIYLGATVEGRYIDSVLSSEPNARVVDPVLEDRYQLDGYFTLDLALSTVDLDLFKIGETFAQLKVSNVTNEKYYYPGFRDYEVPALGRTFFFLLTQQLRM